MNFQDKINSIITNGNVIPVVFSCFCVYYFIHVFIITTQVQGSRFTINPDFIGIFFMFPERHSVFLGL